MGDVQRLARELFLSKSILKALIASAVSQGFICPPARKGRGGYRGTGAFVLSEETKTIIRQIAAQRENEKGDVAELAERLKVKPDAIYGRIRSLVAQGKITPPKKGRRTLILSQEQKQAIIKAHQAIKEEAPVMRLAQELGVPNWIIRSQIRSLRGQRGLQPKKERRGNRNVLILPPALRREIIRRILS